MKLSESRSRLILLQLTPKHIIIIKLIQSNFLYFKFIYENKWERISYVVAHFGWFLVITESAWFGSHDISRYVGPSDVASSQICITRVVFIRRFINHKLIHRCHFFTTVRFCQPSLIGHVSFFQSNTLITMHWSLTRPRI